MDNVERGGTSGNLLQLQEVIREWVRACGIQPERPFTWRDNLGLSDGIATRKQS
jgi:hypothetical protein